MAGLEQPVSGSIVIGGVTVAGPANWVEPEHRRVGMVFQEAALFPHLTVWKNVRFGVKRLPDADQRAQAALDLVGLNELPGRFPDELSGGQQQRVALARALAPAPKVILLDEPFAGLDAGLREHVRAEVQAILMASGTTAILVTHDQQEALSFATMVAVMDQGKILQFGSPEDIYMRPSCEAVAEFIGDGSWVECLVVDGRFECCFGSGACEAGDGAGKLFVRPEDFLLVPDGRRAARAGILEDRRFFGYQVAHRIRFDDGASIEVRSPAALDLTSGRRYGVALREGKDRVFQESG
jgi:iron(III) transport system ATP-binding protein